MVVLLQLLESMQQHDATIAWYIVAEPNTLSCLPISDKIIRVPYTWARKSPLHLLYWYEFELPKLITREKIDICFSITNFLPRQKLSCPSLLLIHNAGFFSAAFIKSSLKDYFLWQRKIKWVHHSIKRATAVTIQTQALSDKIARQLNISPEKIFTIPHGPGFLKMGTQKMNHFPIESCWRIGYVSKFGPQKDFATAIKAVAALKEKGINIKLILTLNQTTREYPSIARQIHQYGIDDCVENLGEVTDPSTLQTIYESLHLFIFPSLVESFGFTLVEAMGFGLPIVAAGTDGNREITGMAGEFFQPSNADELAEKILRLMTNKDLYLLASQKSKKRCQDFSWNIAGQAILNIMRQMLPNNGREV